MDMARGVRAAAGSDWSLSVTGIAGPGGGSEDKPVGTVWFGIDSDDGTFARGFLFSGDRTLVRRRSVLAGLQCLRMELLKMRCPLAWEITS